MARDSGCLFAQSLYRKPPASQAECNKNETQCKETRRGRLGHRHDDVAQLGDAAEQYFECIRIDDVEELIARCPRSEKVECDGETTQGIADNEAGNQRQRVEEAIVGQAGIRLDHDRIPVGGGSGNSQVFVQTQVEPDCKFIDIASGGPGIFDRIVVLPGISDDVIDRKGDRIGDSTSGEEEYREAQEASYCFHLQTPVSYCFLP